MPEGRTEDRTHSQEAGPQTRESAKERALKETVETLASAYFTACRKLARAINRLKD